MAEAKPQTDPMTGNVGIGNQSQQDQPKAGDPTKTPEAEKTHREAEAKKVDEARINLGSDRESLMPSAEDDFDKLTEKLKQAGKRYKDAETKAAQATTDIDKWREERTLSYREVVALKEALDRTLKRDLPL